MKIKIFLGVLILFCIIGLIPTAHGLMMGNIPDGFAPGIEDPKRVTELAKAYCLMIWLIMALGITCLVAIIKDVLDEIQDNKKQ